ncbi:MAG: ABC transporter ATP-binding protein [Hespellia sp.]|nr:ABC transporter ATP-binding protein [Hespellia sp.]
MKKEKEKQGIPRLLELAGEKNSAMSGSILLSTTGTLLQLTPFIAVYYIMAELLQNAANKTPLDAPYMIHMAVYGLVGLLAGYLFTYAGGMMSHTFAYKVICKLRLKVAEHIGKLPMGYLNGTSVGKIKQIMDADIEQMEGFLAHQLPDFVSTLVMLAALFIMMFSLNGWMALACLLTIVIGFACQLIVMLKIMKSGGVKANFDALENISNSSLQYVKGMPSIKIFGQTVKSFRKFYQDIMDYRDFTIKMTEQIRPGFVRFRVLIQSIATFILPVGLLLLLKKPDDVAYATTFIFFLVLGPGAATPTLKLRTFSESMNVITEGVTRVNEILNERVMEEPEISQIPDFYDIDFKNVDFSYQKDKGILNKVSFQAKQGEITALVGPSGAGKSTIAELIPRFWDVTNGSISIGGINIKNMSSKDLMEQMSFVFQESFLFSDTIYNNIALGKPGATKTEVESAAKAAQCHNFIMALPNGYDTKIGDGGAYLSGGEEQRVSIARAILKDAPILILDEASAYADAENEHEMQRALAKLIQNKTVIMIAHRLATICNANQILVIDHGMVSECGTHDTLIKRKGIYSHMWEASMGASAWTMDSEKEV